MTIKPTISGNRFDNDIVSNADWNRDALQAAFYIDEVLHGTNADKIAAGAISGTAGIGDNILVNGGFEYWQRGPGTFGSGFTADRWGIAVAGGSGLNVTRAAAQDTGSGSQYQAQGTYAHAAGGIARLFQNVENWREYRGRTVYFFARCLTSVNAAGFLQIGDGVSGANSNLTGNNTITSLNGSYTVALNATTLQLSFVMNSVTCNYIIDNAMMTLGVVPADFRARTRPDEDYYCTRYYQVLHPSCRWRSTSANEIANTHMPYPTVMAGTPTATLTAGSKANTGTSAIGNADTQAIRYEVYGLAANTDSFEINAKLVLEYNP